MKLTVHMAEALGAARHAPLRRVHKPGPGSPPWPTPAVTLAALVRHGLVVAGRLRNRDGWLVDTWTITDAGRAALQPRERFLVDRPVFLADRRKATPDWYDPAGEECDEDYTSDPGRRIDELEVIDDDAQRVVSERGRRNDAQRSTLATAGRASQTLEDRLARIRAEAAEQGVDIARQEASIARRIEAIEARVRRRAA